MSQILDPRAPESASAKLLREKVYEQLRADLISCRLAPGAEIRESELAERFGVSKSPVRDALMRLERENLVITLPRQGYRVASVSVNDVQDMFQLREVLERACIERITRRASEQQLASLERFRRFDPGAWEGGFVAYNRSFHRELAAISGNARMRDHLFDLMDQMERAVQLSVNSLKRGNPQTVIDEHSALIDALQARQTSVAQRISARHVQSAGKRVLRAMTHAVIAP